MRRLLIVAALVTLASACSPDATRARLEPDVSATFVNAIQLSRSLQGLAPASIGVTSDECHNGSDPAADSGPGTWTCNLAYVVDGIQRTVLLGLTVDTLGCYAAVDGAHHDSTILDRHTGARTADPKVGFDGCFDPYADPATPASPATLGGP